MGGREKTVGGGLLVAAAAMLAFSAFAHTWWVQPEGTLDSKDVGFGLLGIASDGWSHSWADVTSYWGTSIPDHSTFLTLGRVSFGLTLLSCLAIAGTLVRLLVGATLYHLVRYAVGIAAGMVMLHLSMRPDILTDHTSFGLAFYVFYLGVIFAISGDVIVERGMVTSAERPAPPAAHLARPRMIECPQCAALFEESSRGCSGCGWSIADASRTAQQQMMPRAIEATQRPCPACPQCRAPTTWMQEYERFLCTRCNVYV
jgi:hypothetical protein